MKKILVIYATMSGTTADVAKTIAEELQKRGESVSSQPISDVKNLTECDAVILGAPMIMGWQRNAVKFLNQYRIELTDKKLALFATAMNLTQSGETKINGVPVYVDPKLAEMPACAEKLSYKERFCSIPAYVQPMLKAAGKTKPVSVALFGGRLDIYRLRWWAALFVMIVIHARPGEKRNWDAIREWAGGLFSDL